jgi:thiamine kinase-like enzyme
VHGVGAPLLHDFRITSDWFDVPVMCMAFVHGHQRPPTGEEDAEGLGHTVGRIHALPVTSLSAWPGADLTLEGYLDATMAKMDRRLPCVRDPLPAAEQRRLREVRSRLDESLVGIRASVPFRKGDALTLLHGDVAGGNIFWTPAPVLIDWEYSRIGDPADEIAYIFNQNALDETDRRAFWRGYQEGRGRVSMAALVERVTWWEPVAVLASAFFWVERWLRRAVADEAGQVDQFVPRDQAYYRRKTLQRLVRADALLSDRAS